MTTPTKPSYISGGALAAAITALGVSLSNSAAELPPVDFLTVEIPQGQTGTDISSALADSLATCESEDHPSARVGCRVRIPAGQHRITETVVVCRATEFFGDGGTGYETATRISVAPNVTAFRVGSVSECESRGEGFTGAWSRISSMTVISEPCANEPGGCVPHFGINMHARAHVEDVYIRGFTHGIHISADVTRLNTCDGTDADCKTNANLWSLERVSIRESAHAGVFVRGGDSNAGLGVMVSAVGNCLDPSPYDGAWGTCANIVDASFLGNTWLAPHTSADNATTASHPAYVARGATQRSLFLGAYAEVNQDASELSQNSMAIGGLSGWGLDTVGVRMDGANWYGRFYIHNRFDDNNRTRVGFGNLMPGLFLEMSAPNMRATWPLRLKSRLWVLPGAPPGCSVALDECTSVTDVTSTGEPCSSCIGGEYLFDVANLGAGRAIGIAGAPSTTLGDTAIYGAVQP